MASTSDRATIDAVASDLDDELIALRRDIHRWPELAGGERRTAALVAERLRAAGLTVSTGVGGHGVVAAVDGVADGPTIAYRADLDAVAGDEEFDSEFASQVPGAAHLCGHDIHTTVGVGIAQVLAKVRHRLQGRVVFIFQPAEETLEGAQAMLADGVLARAEPHEIYALHCAPLPVGTFAVMPGSGQPGLDRCHIALAGPHAEAEGARLRAEIEAWATVAYPRTPEESQQLFTDLQTPDGPLARFVFVHSDLTTDDQQAELRVNLRAWPDDRYPQLRADLRRLVAPVAGARIDFPECPFPAMVCSPELSEAAATYLRDTFGSAAVVVLHAAFPFNGEDFGLFLQHVPGAMILLGGAEPATGHNGAPHTPDFAADERAIGVGVRAIAGLLSNRLAVLPASGAIPG
ncbi:M20/M25/M40 family metallo-hydrolase [Natronosporangium hydrolyticum]|uniref:M20/M25/M40 family metallo-hydrolase n=1 Tax=Natronosporangium hydrolyticum TaxID=2811111 RepID=A0A895YPQ5_9ACTN|nr:M20/M25/M40 family metallo-hydrolase [Natronosporangium hydrolyticum]QSB16716.1 M20/M25/M40 family metallo-hydrolase [Natronosporangium hydrolyticum]